MCAYIYILIHIYAHMYAHTHIYFYCIYCPKLNSSWEPSLEVDYRLRQTTVDTDLQYLLEEFCRSAKATQLKMGLLSNQSDDVIN